jgi:hypothetical protein
LNVQKPFKKKPTIVLFSLLFIFGILVFCIFIVVKTIGFYPLSKIQLKEKTQKVFLDMGIDTCSVANVAFTSFNTISLQDLSLVKQIDHAKKITGKLSRIDIHYNPITILFKWNTCKKILQDKINDILYVNSNQQNSTVFNSPKFKGKFLRLLYDELSVSGTALFSCVRSIKLDSDFINIDSLDSQILHLQNMSAIINTEKNIPENHEIKIRIATERVSFIENSISNLYATLTIDGPECKTTFKSDSFFNGTLEGDFLFDLSKNLILNGKITLDSSNLEKIYAFYKYKTGSLNGTCSIRIIFDSNTADFSFLSGTGSIHAINVNVRKLPILNQIAEVTMLSGLSDLHFDNINGDFTFGEGTIKSKNLTGKGNPLSIDLSGWIKPDSSSFSINVKGTFQSYYKDSISSLVWETMFPENDKGRSFRCTIYGTQESPSISVDKNFATRAINNVIKSIGDELKSFFK